MSFQQRVTGTWLVAFVAVAVGGCATRTTPLPDLGTRFDCLRERKLAVVAAHRGQPDPSAAENAMSSFTASLAAGVPFLEVDVATTRDGVLVLMHDDTLDRTTTGTGPVNGRTWAEVRRLKLRRPDGTVLVEGVPRFADVLDWGRRAGAHFELDVKKTTKWSDVIDTVRAAGVERQVLVVTYTLADAKIVHGLDPRLVISVEMGKPGDLEAALRLLPADRMLGWTGLREPGTSTLAALRDAGIEPILGTLGRAGERLDDVYVADGNPSEYVDLVRSGVVMIASDRAVAAQGAIGLGYRACLQPR
ncbi:MAG: glycerophosphodiester phosphodiesterase [Acidobacteria bacterium]|nr:MAG: glycerophosphodiester phosphodiesterase [Acidobacteriota bacterium]